MTEGFNGHHIHVRGLDSSVDLALLGNIFSMFGEVCYVSLKERRLRLIKDAFISYRHKREAQNAIEVMDGLYLIGSPTRVEWAFGWPREESDPEPLLAQPVPTYPQLLDTVLRQMLQNDELRFLIRKNWQEFMRMYNATQGPPSTQPVLAGTSPLESSQREATDIEWATAPSTSATPRILQLQSEPDIHPTGLAIASVPESAEPNGATHAKATERKSKKRKKVEVTKVNRKVKKTKTVDFQCKICLDKHIRVVFLPCGHLVSCRRCAKRISICPMCRKQITGKVRIYLS